MNAPETVSQSTDGLVNIIQCRLKAALAVLNGQIESLPEAAFAAVYLIEDTMPMLEDLAKAGLSALHGRAHREVSHG